MRNKTIGWIGTGLMGNPMAMHLVDAGYNLVVHNRTESKAGNLIERGCQWASTPSEVAEKADTLFTIIGYPKDVEEVYFGDRGILSSIRQGSILIDMTTTKPSLAQRIFARTEAEGATSIDAPVSGGVIGAQNGTLSVMIGGRKEVVDDLMPLFQTFGKNIIYQGGAGSGQHTKMCNQITIVSTMIGVSESLVYGLKAGLDLEKVLQSISKGAAGCWSLDNLAPKILSGDFSPGFFVDHFVKDLGIALEEAEKMDLKLPGLALGKQFYESLQKTGRGELGTQALYLALKERSGI